MYVRPFTGKPAVRENKIQVSTSGGDFPVWSRDGSELLYIGRDLKLYSVRSSDFARIGAVPRPQSLFVPCSDTSLAGTPLINAPWQHPYDLSADSRRFLFVCNKAREGYQVMLNWRSIQ